jgi:hypothetical protein
MKRRDVEDGPIKGIEQQGTVSACGSKRLCASQDLPLFGCKLIDGTFSMAVRIGQISIFPLRTLWRCKAELVLRVRRCALGFGVQGAIMTVLPIQATAVYMAYES